MNNSVIYFSKINPKAIFPSKHNGDAGYDIYACFDEDRLIIKPHESKLVPTGIASAFSEDYAFIFYERGSTGTKNIKVNAGVIDASFRGEWFVCLYNANDIPLIITKRIDEYNDKSKNRLIYPYSKAIAQALLIPVPKVHINNIDYKKLKEFTSERGTGMLGSTNK